MLPLPQRKVALVSFGLALFSPTRGSSQSPMGGDGGPKPQEQGPDFSSRQVRGPKLECGTFRAP